jgi:uncharacterized protein YjbI with pentapeptide repeats
VLVTGGRYTPRLRGLLLVTVAAVLTFLLLSLAILTLFAWLTGVRLLPLAAGSISGSALSDLVRSTVSAGTLVAGTFALVYAYRKQRFDEAASFRADGEQFSKRYQDGAIQLGHERAAVRLAGVYAISRLADDWPDNRQMCVNLLCAYLRMPYLSKIENDDESVVRESVFEIIRQHVQDPDSLNSWCRFEFDFSGGTYDSVNLNGGKFYNGISFQDSRFAGMERRKDGKNFGWINLTECVFKKGISFFQSDFRECVVSFDGSSFEEGHAFFGGAEFKDFNLFFREARFLGGQVYFGGGSFTRDNPGIGGNLGNVWFNDAEFCGSEVRFNSVRVSGRVEIEFDSVSISSGSLDLSGLELESRCEGGPSLLVAPKGDVDGVLKMPADPMVQLELEFPSQ